MSLLDFPGGGQGGCLFSNGLTEGGLEYILVSPSEGVPILTALTGISGLVMIGCPRDFIVRKGVDLAPFWTRPENKKKILSLLEKGYSPYTSPDKFVAEFPSKSLEAISRAVRRYFKDISVPEVSIEERIEKDRTVLRLSAEIKEVKELYTTLLDRENIADRLVSAFQLAIDKRQSLTVPIPNITTSKTRKPLVAVLDVSDIHHSEVVLPESTLGLGDYDTQMSRARLAFMAEKSMMIVKEIIGHQVDEMSVHILGDIVTGMIHDELARNAEMFLADAVCDVAIALALMILDLARNFKVVKVRCVSGNHGRFNKKPAFKEDAVNNWDFIVYQFMSILLANQENVIFEIPRSFWYLADVNGFGSLLMHGQFIKSWGGIPYYGIFRTATNLTDLININIRRKILDKQEIDILEIMNVKDPNLLDFKYIEMGHFHSSAILNKSSVEIIMNGSVIGNGEFNIFNMTNGQDPKQWLLLAHPTEGYTGRYPISLSHATRDMGDRYSSTKELDMGSRFREAVVKVIERSN